MSITIFNIGDRVCCEGRLSGVVAFTGTVTGIRTVTQTSLVYEVTHDTDTNEVTSVTQSIEPDPRPVNSLQVLRLPSDAIDARIGLLIREGVPHFYAFANGDYFESQSRSKVRQWAHRNA